MNKSMVLRMAILAVDGVYYHCAYEESYHDCKEIEGMKQWALDTLEVLKNNKISNDDIIRIVELAEQYNVEINKY